MPNWRLMMLANREIRAPKPIESQIAVFFNIKDRRRYFIQSKLRCLSNFVECESQAQASFTKREQSKISNDTTACLIAGY